MFLLMDLNLFYLNETLDCKFTKTQTGRLFRE